MDFKFLFSTTRLYEECRLQDPVEHKIHFSTTRTRSIGHCRRTVTGGSVDGTTCLVVLGTQAVARAEPTTAQTSGDNQHMPEICASSSASVSSVLTLPLHPTRRHFQNTSGMSTPSRFFFLLGHSVASAHSCMDCPTVGAHGFGFDCEIA